MLTKCDCAATDRLRARQSALETSSVTGHGHRRHLRERIAPAGARRRRNAAATWWPARPCAAPSRSGWPAQCLERARQVAAAGQEELAAAEIRAALDELGKVVGAVYTEDVLDRIFSRFCVGK